jgi:hypothetical protein
MKVACALLSISLRIFKIAYNMPGTVAALKFYIYSIYMGLHAF